MSNACKSLRIFSWIWDSQRWWWWWISDMLYWCRKAVWIQANGVRIRPCLLRDIPGAIGRYWAFIQYYRATTMAIVGKSLTHQLTSFTFQQQRSFPEHNYAHFGPFRWKNVTQRKSKHYIGIEMGLPAPPKYILIHVPVSVSRTELSKLLIF